MIKKSKRVIFMKTKKYLICMTSHPATRRRGDVVTMSLCMSQRRRRYVSNETSNDVSVERRQDVSVVRPHDISNKSQMKHPTTSQSFGRPIHSYWFKLSCLSCAIFICIHCFFVKMMKLYKDTCSAWKNLTSAEIFFS